MSDATVSILDTPIDIAALPDLLDRLKPIFDKLKNLTLEEIESLIAAVTAATSDGKVTLFEIIRIAAQFFAAIQSPPPA